MLKLENWQNKFVMVKDMVRHPVWTGFSMQSFKDSLRRLFKRSQMPRAILTGPATNYKPYQKNLEGSSPDEILAIAKKLVGGVAAVRKSDQSVNWLGGIVAFAFIFGVPIGYFSWLSYSVDSGARVAGARATQNSLAVRNSGGFVTMPTLTPLHNRSIVSASLPTYTPYPTYTPLPTYTVPPVPTPEIVAGLFSFYDPEIGADKPEIGYVNCERWDEVNKICPSFLRDGSRYQDHYGDTVACDESLYRVRASYRVVSPDWLVKLAPFVTCRDTGEAVIYPVFDFLLRWKDMPVPWEQTPWRAAIVLERIK